MVHIYSYGFVAVIITAEPETYPRRTADPVTYPHRTADPGGLQQVFAAAAQEY